MVGRYSGNEYLEDHPDWHDSDAAWKAGHVAELITRNGLSPKTLADVGCGAGGALKSLAKLFPGIERLDGYDIAPRAIDLARSGRFDERLTFQVQEFAASSGPSYDILLALDVIEHVEDYFGFLRKIRPRARHAIFHIPLDMHAAGVLFDAQMTARDAVGHLHYFSKSTALRTLEDTGYRPFDSILTAGALELDNDATRGWKARAARIPRRLMHAVSPDFAARALGGFSLMVLATTSDDD